MNSSKALFAVAIYCFLHLGPTSCKRLETISEEELAQGLLKLKTGKYNEFLIYSVVAASSGKNLFKTPQSLSEDCVRTTKIALQSFEKLSSLETAVVALRNSFSEATPHEANNTFHSQVELICKILKKNLKSSPLAFDESEVSVQIPKPAKNYILEIPAGEKVEEWVKNTHLPFDDPQWIKFTIVLTLLKFPDTATDEKQRELVAAANAVERMARRSTFKSTVDSVFKSALDDFTKNLLAQGVDKLTEDNLKSQGPAFVKKLDQEFLDNVLLKEEYSKMKKEVMKPRPSKL